MRGEDVVMSMKSLAIFLMRNRYKKDDLFEQAKS